MGETGIVRKPNNLVPEPAEGWPAKIQGGTWHDWIRWGSNDFVVAAAAATVAVEDSGTYGDPKSFPWELVWTALVIAGAGAAGRRSDPSYSNTQAVLIHGLYHVEDPAEGFERRTAPCLISPPNSQQSTINEHDHSIT